MKKRILSLATAFMMLFGAMAPAAKAAVVQPPEEQPAPHVTTVNLHKVVMSKEEMEAHDQNKTYDPVKGITQEEYKTFFGASAKPAEGVFFIAFKDGEEQDYQDLLNIIKDPEGNGYTAENLADQIIEDFKDPESKQEVRAGLTTAEGVLPLKLEDGNWTIYEIKQLSNYKEDGKDLAGSKAVPVKLSLPFSNEAGVQDVINVYPKNTDSSSKVDKTVGDMTSKNESYRVGETHTWYIQATVGENPQDYQVFGLTDDIDTKLDYKGNVKVYLVNDANQKQGQDFVAVEDYTLTQPEVDAAGGKLEVMLTEAGIKKLVEGQKLVVAFDTAINKTAVMGKDIPNDVELTFGNNPNNPKKVTPTPPGTPPTPPEDNPNLPKVHTGGKRFVKQDATTPETKLQDAEFKLFAYTVEEQKEVNGEMKTVKKVVAQGTQGAKEEYVKVDDATGAVTFVTEAEATVLKSAADGSFEIKGLPYENAGSKYYLKETKAPKDYVLPANPVVEFTVDKTSYYADPDKVTTGTQAGDADQQAIGNNKQEIPATGGIGTMIFTVAGLALMSFAFIALKKSKANA